mmetsp:Transcript_4194/g.10647  ORF Transcript_4194/g.10647 Transcript_4194/m.10647 type:complete len:291 (-) Transcript_4194:1384-2256(-)
MSDSEDDIPISALAGAGPAASANGAAAATSARKASANGSSSAAPFSAADGDSDSDSEDESILKMAKSIKEEYTKVPGKKKQSASRKSSETKEKSKEKKSKEKKEKSAKASSKKRSREDSSSSPSRKKTKTASSSTKRASASTSTAGLTVLGKHLLVEQILKRWKYCLPSWPQGVKKEAPEGYITCGFQGLFIGVQSDTLGNILDMRDKKNGQPPIRSVLLQLDSAELREILSKGIDAQREDLMKSKLSESASSYAETLALLDSDAKTLKGFKPLKLEKEFKAFLKKKGKL